MNITSGRIIVGKYELLQVAGEGGMATVWQAIMHGAAGFSRPVAVKHIQPTLACSQDFVAMFIEEARVGSQLIYPNIVQIFDFVEGQDGAYYLVMEWVEGLDLGRYIAAFQTAGQLPPWPLVTAVIVEALRGLSAAHMRTDNQGRLAPVIHRDVTPQNILVGTNGIIKLSDFGLARAMDRARMTRPDIIKGKLGYHAPEVTFGLPATPQSDLFSLGIVFWEGLAGRRLYEGGTDAEVFLRAREAKIPPIQDVRDDLPPQLIKSLQRALDKAPEKRFSSSKEMLRALTATLRQVPVSTDCFTISQSIIQARRLLDRSRVELS